jgi:hypothetical protein
VKRLPFLLLGFLPLLGAPADVVTLTDGKTLEGRVSETPEGIQILLPNGGALFLPKDRVARVEKKPTAVEVFQERRKALAPDDLEGRLDLAEWAKAQGFERPMQRLLREVLALDPGNLRAQTLLGRVQVGTLFLTPDEALRQGFVPLEEGWGELEARYEEDERALGLEAGILAEARGLLEKALAGEADAPARMAALALPSRAWTVLLHRRDPPPPARPPSSGRIEDLTGLLAWIPQSDGARESPCLLALADGEEGLEGAYARWLPLARAQGMALFCAAGAEHLHAWDKLAERGLRPDLNRLVLGGFGSGADAGWEEIRRHPDRYAAAVLGSGAPRMDDLPDLKQNAQDLRVLALLGRQAPGAWHESLGNLLPMLSPPFGMMTLAILPDVARELPSEALGKALAEAGALRRVPWPRRMTRRAVSAGEAQAWVRVETLRAPADGIPAFEAQRGTRNTLFLATRGLATLTLLLSDDLVDLSKPVTVVLNGRQAFRALVPADLGLMLAEYRRTGDRHRLVGATLTLEIPPEKH